MKKPSIIAEVKTLSPFGFKSDKPWDELFRLAEKVGDILSIHTDPRWGGSFEILAKARRMTSKPILAKGIHERDDDIQRALDLGADLVLAVGRIPEIRQYKLIIEPLNLAQLSHISPSLKALWNSRDLSDGGLKKESFEEARSLFKGWLCQASNIRTIDDVQESADAILVGAHLQEFADSLENRG